MLRASLAIAVLVSTTASAQDCLVGCWQRPVCGGAKFARVEFAPSGMGQLFNPDCKDICTDLIFPYSWSSTGSSVTLTYSTPPAVTCTGFGTSAPPTPRSDTASVSCNGNSMTMSGESYTRPSSCPIASSGGSGSGAGVGAGGTRAPDDPGWGCSTQPASILWWAALALLLRRRAC